MSFRCFEGYALTNASIPSHPPGHHRSIVRLLQDLQALEHPISDSAKKTDPRRPKTFVASRRVTG